MQEEIKSLQSAREKAEQNVAELKDKLRQELLKNQQAKTVIAEHSHRSNARERYQDDTVDKAKYDELVEAVLGLELAQDPLSEMNLSLHQSFIDELEHATGHLDEQKRLVNQKIEQQEVEIKALKDRCDELMAKKDELFQVAQRDNHTA